MQTTQRSVPAVGEVFELTLTTPIDAMEMVEWAGYNRKGWKYNGTLFVPGTGRFTLEQAGYQPNLDGVRQKQGPANVPQGFWLKAFEEAFPRNDGKGPIGCADASWGYPHGSAGFLVLFERGKGWDRDFDWAGIDRNDRWRWLQACK